MPQRPPAVLLDNVALKVLREKDGQTRVGLAEATGYSLGYICDLETGRRGGNPAVIKNLAQALNVPVSMLERRRTSAA